ncbi:MAG: nitrogenase component 1 [Synergistaceae bacterium]|nr:nitrogenase component 1 [Synergistaceae bacterium]
MMADDPFFATIKELAVRRQGGLMNQTVPRCHLHYNSPGASGFGVKRTGLLLPEAMMLMVAPGCCGRHGTIAGNETGFADRICYMHMDERDLVTGRHLARISQAAKEICDSTKPRPKVLMICTSCIDALLGTDLERVCRKAEQTCGIPVVPAYMDPITREGKKPPMASIQQSLYYCLKHSEQRSDTVNLLGNFVPLDDDCELRLLLSQAGIQRMNQISACRTFEEYMEMGQASLDLVLTSLAIPAAEDLKKKLGIPYHRLEHLYDINAIREQYSLLAETLEFKLNDTQYYDEARHATEIFSKQHRGMKFAVGQTVNGNPFEISAALIKYGMEVPFIFTHMINEEDRRYIRMLKVSSPETRVYSSVYPAMLNYSNAMSGADVAIGLDAGYYFPDAVCLSWNTERQPFGYRGLISLLRQIEDSIANPKSHREQMHGSYLVI